LPSQRDGRRRVEEELNTDFEQVAAWVNTSHRDSRTLRISSRGAKTAGSAASRHPTPRLPPQLSGDSDLTTAAVVEANTQPEQDAAKSEFDLGHSGRLKQADSPVARRQSGADYYRDLDEGNAGSQLFSVLELPAEIDPSQCVAVLANGLVGIRMPKRRSSAH
jgi:hypothetical protein